MARPLKPRFDPRRRRAEYALALAAPVAHAWGMKNSACHRLLFAAAAFGLALPWLTPCTLGVGTVGSALVSNTSRRIQGDDSVLRGLRDPQLRAWAAKPGPALTIIQHAVIPHAALITEEELAAGGEIFHGSPPDNLARTGATSTLDSVASLLALSDVTFQMVAGSPNELPAMPWPTKHSNRQRIVLCQSPYVLLQAKEIVYAKNGAQPPHLVRASGGARVTIITPEGTYFALATRIHFRGSSIELLLEGNPTVQSGSQHIKGARNDALMKLNFHTQTVSLIGQADETRF